MSVEIYRWFEKTDCLITAVGSEDTQISPEGPTNYVVPPPLSIYVEMDPVAPTPAVKVQDANVPDVDDDMSELEEIETISEERIDLAVDRTRNHLLVNRTVTVCSMNVILVPLHGTIQNYMIVSCPLYTDES